MAEWSKELDTRRVGWIPGDNRAFFASQSFYLHLLKVVFWVGTFVLQFWLLVYETRRAQCS